MTEPDRADADRGPGTRSSPTPRSPPAGGRPARRCRRRGALPSRRTPGRRSSPSRCCSSPGCWPGAGRCCWTCPPPAARWRRSSWAPPCATSRSRSPRRPVAGVAPARRRRSVLAAFGHQLLRTDGRPRLVESLSGEVMAVALLACATAVVALPRTKAGADAVLALGPPAPHGHRRAAAVPRAPVGASPVVAATAAGGWRPGSPRTRRPTTGWPSAWAWPLPRRAAADVHGPAGLGLPARRAVMAVAPLAASGIVAYVLARLFVG